LYTDSKKKDDLSDCYLQALTYLTFKQPVSVKKGKPVIITKATLKKQLKEFLDPLIKNCSVMEIMEKSFKTIGELQFPFEINEPIEDLLSKVSMKKYKDYRYL
jgi:hypothetical protein